MGEWAKDNPISYGIIIVLFSTIIFAIFIRAYVDKRIDNRIINEYQKPLTEKLDTLINYFENE